MATNTAITALATDAGIRIFAKTAEGKVWGLFNDVKVEDLDKARSSGDIDAVRTKLSQGWRGSGYYFSVAKNSNLASYPWFWKPINDLDWDLHVSIFYQEKKTNDICQWDWNLSFVSGRTGLRTGNALPGTKIAVAASTDGTKAIVFYQDNDGYLCYRKDSQATDIYDVHWDGPAVRLLKAAKGTGIAATAWDELGVIRVYYQDPNDFTVKEYCGKYDSDKWTPGLFSSAQAGIVSISASSQPGFGIRVYIQSEADGVTEECWTTGGHVWATGAFYVNTHTEKTKTDIGSFIWGHNLAKGPFSSVLWTTTDTIYQTIGTGSVWLEPISNPFTKWNDAKATDASEELAKDPQTRQRKQ